MANDHNLIPAKPGEVRNPKGKPKGTKNRATIFKEFLELKAAKVNFKSLDAESLPDGMTLEQAMHFKMIDNVISAGDTAAFKEIQDTLHGKITDKVETTHSFAQMGKVEVKHTSGSSDAIPATVELKFDIGSEVPKDDNADTA